MIILYLTTQAQRYNDLDASAVALKASRDSEFLMYHVWNQVIIGGLAQGGKTALTGRSILKYYRDIFL